MYFSYHTIPLWWNIIYSPLIWNGGSILKLWRVRNLATHPLDIWKFGLWGEIISMAFLFISLRVTRSSPATLCSTHSFSATSIAWPYLYMQWVQQNEYKYTHHVQYIAYCLRWKVSQLTIWMLHILKCDFECRNSF